jgi:hypothetical protein
MSETTLDHNHDGASSDLLRCFSKEFAQFFRFFVHLPAMRPPDCYSAPGLTPDRRRRLTLANIDEALEPSRESPSRVGSIWKPVVVKVQLVEGNVARW